MKVEIDDYHEAVARFEDYFGVYKRPRLMDFLGKGPDLTPHDPEYFSFPDEKARKIHLLLGPHYKTILKAWEILNKEQA